ncbi:caspase, EACC1-associated type [Nocardia inohanensis]|uniref:caspase, EACC1-associated type n=1 Tax=Nocardia inohanensis TaxID=209246 RepID=UPI000A00FF37|nr:caspase family protein [Nocardia inohanensis]
MSDKGGWRAVLIGVSKYDDENFKDVPAALNSVRAVKDILTDPDLCGWPEGSVTVIEDPRRPIDIGRPIRDAADEATGALLVYFVGHGELSETNDLCLVVGETEQKHVELTSLEYDKIRSILKGSIADVKIVILDCCNSGKAIDSLSSTESQIANTTVISGAYTLSAAEQAAHVPIVQGAETKTSFTNALVDIIRVGVSGGGEFLDLSTIYASLIKKLSADGLPKPNQRGTDTVENFTFARNVSFEIGNSSVRANAKQIPVEPTEVAMLDAIRQGFKAEGAEFSRCAIALWKLVAPSTGVCEVDRAVTARVSAVSGKYVLGPAEDPIELDFVLDAYCTQAGRSVGHASMDRLIARIGSNHFGVLLTLSYVDDDVYRHIRDDREPVVVVCGQDIVDALKMHGCPDAASVREWIAGQVS